MRGGRAATHPRLYDLPPDRLGAFIDAMRRGDLREAKQRLVVELFRYSTEGPRQGGEYGVVDGLVLVTRAHGSKTTHLEPRPDGLAHTVRAPKPKAPKVKRSPAACTETDKEALFRSMVIAATRTFAARVCQQSKAAGVERPLADYTDADRESLARQHLYAVHHYNVRLSAIATAAEMEQLRLIPAERWEAISREVSINTAA